jgi:hypothetical protein
MSLGLKASADGSTIDIMLGATVLASLSLNGLEAGTLIALAAEAQGFTNTKKLLSPEMLGLAFKGANQSLATSGYQKLPGGLIIQWGNANTSSSANVGLDVALPIAFPNATLIVTSGLQNGQPTSNPAVQAFFKNLSTITISCATAPASTVAYIALGR